MSGGNLALEERAKLARVAFRGFMTALASETGIDPLAALAVGPVLNGRTPGRRDALGRVGGVGDQIYLEAMRLRRAAFYLTVTELDLPIAIVHRGIGVSKQWVSKACHRVEDLRDDPAFEASLDRAVKLILG